MRREWQMFNLSRYFSTLSLALVLSTGGVLGYFYYSLSVDQLVSLAQDRNVAMTQVFRNTLWPRYGAFLGIEGARDADALRRAPETARLHADVVAQMRETEVVKAKAYNRTGITVYSSDPAQIGEYKGSNPGFLQALAGRPASELTHRNTFDSFEGTLSGLDVISSYVPILGDGGRIEGVFELYQDVTHSLATLRRTLWWIAGGVPAILALLYAAQYVVVRRAQAIIRRQAVALQEANRDLDERVRSRTRELEEANRRLEAEIAQRRGAEVRLEHLAHHDPLTGLPNRLAFGERLETAVLHAEQEGRELAVLFVDLDRFKAVNDSLGHGVGDELLRMVAGRIARQMRPVDTLARPGGDELACLVELARGAAEAQAVAAAILAQFQTPFVVGDNDLLLCATIGIALYPRDGRTGEALLRNAETAMYRAKPAGRNAIRLYEPEMTAYATERLRLERELHRSIEEGGLGLDYQAQVDGPTGRLLGAEALVRWSTPELGTVSPARFVPLAEETGIVVLLGEWVLREACRQVVAWDRQGFRLPKVSVNVSVRQLERPDFLDRVGAILAETGLAGDRLELEITESVIMAIDDTLAVLQKLRAMGIRLSVDDFGTGYSSLSYLKLLPIGRIKIDRAFVSGIGRSPGDEAIIRTVATLARSLGLELVAEGVEAASQADFLARVGCTALQGHLHGRPLPAAAFLEAWATRAGA
jgi:diguanylate cyclase (GGDEF)-like protein